MSDSAAVNTDVRGGPAADFAERRRRALTDGRAPLRSYAPVETLVVEPGTGRPLTVRLPNGRPAEYMRRYDDCMVACLATLAGVPYNEVPDIGAIDAGPLVQSQGLADLGGWASGRGWRMRWHSLSSPPPWRHPIPAFARDGWIGGVPPGEFGGAHGVVLVEDRIVFDPGSNLPAPAGEEFVPVTLEEIAFGVTLERKEANP